MNMSVLRTGLVASTMLVAVTLPTAVQAQPAAAGDASPADIVVTAQKRDQRTSDVPLSITALSGQELARLSITQSEQLAMQTPGLGWGGTAGKSKPSIFLRGVGNDDFRAGSNSPVGSYNDGAYLGNAFGYGQLLLDLNRVEVLRGPQGTLWGKNTTGGVINYVPNLAKVGEDANGFVDIGYGDYESVKVNAAAGVPINDVLAARVAFGINRDEGFFHSTNPLTGGHVGGSSWYGVRGSLDFQPSSDFDLVAEVNYSNLDGQAHLIKSLGIFDPAAPPFSFTPCPSPTAGRLGTTCGDVFGVVSSPKPYTVAPSSRQLDRVKTFNPIVKAEWQLGDLTLNSLSSYLKSSKSLHSDEDGTASPLYEYNVQDRFHSISQELRLSSPASNRLNWIVGAYLYRDSLDLYEGYNLSVFGNPQQAVIFRNRSQTYAAFADATYHVTPKLNLTVGLRYTRDQREANGETFLFNAINNRFNDKALALANLTSVVADFNPEKRRQDDNVSGRAVLDYHITPSLLAYASVSRGFKGGDLNSGALSAPEFFITKPEYLTAYQAGLKGTLVDRLVTFDIGTFFYDYKDAQVYTEMNQTTVLSNAGKLHIYGVDGNLSLIPVRGLRADVGYSYLHSRYVSYESPVVGQDYSGNRTPYSPTLQLNGLISYTIPTGPGTGLEIEADATYKTKAYFTAANDDRLAQPRFALLNGSISYHLNEHLTARAWVKNVTNKLYYFGGFGLTFIGTYLVLPGDPRTYGGSLRFEF